MPKSKDCPQDTDFLQYVPTKFQQNRKTMLKKPYYKRLYISDCSRNYRFHKKLSNKKVRRVLDVSSRGGYKKVHDLWWETI